MSVSFFSMFDKTSQFLQKTTHKQEIIGALALTPALIVGGVTADRLMDMGIHKEACVDFTSRISEDFNRNFGQAFLRYKDVIQMYSLNDPIINSQLSEVTDNGDAVFKNTIRFFEHLHDDDPTLSAIFGDNILGRMAVGQCVGEVTFNSNTVDPIALSNFTLSDS